MWLSAKNRNGKKNSRDFFDYMFCKLCGNEIKNDSRFCTKCGSDIQSVIKPKNKRKFLTKKGVLVGTSILVILIIPSIFVYFYLKPQSSSADQRQLDIASTVVNIYCEGASGWNGDSVSGGSGTIITTDGLVLTNAHIIPSGKDASTDEKSCMVILPDPETGSAKEMYYAKPIVFPDISEKYDLAFIQIDDVYYDTKEGKAYGQYPRVFPAYDSDKYCKNENVKLGEPVRIYGYPAISNDGYALTITDGIVSSLLPKDGYIITSAGISHGNSGGLAVDQYGCRIGIPSMVTGDNYESLGVIISNNLIADFTDEIKALLDLNKTSTTP